MARPLRYGPTIGVRLPLELYERITSDVGVDEIGPWIRDLVVNSLEALDHRIAAAKAKVVNPPEDHSPDGDHPCDHPVPHDVRTGGMHVCRLCGAVRGIDGKWRQP